MRVQGIARYTHIANPGAPKGSDKKRHSVDILIHETDPQCAVINAAVAAAKANGFPSGFPANGHICWEKLPAEGALAGYWSLSANTKVEHGRPTFVNSALQEIIDPAADGKTDGKIVYADVGIASYDQVSKGVKAYLNGLMVTDQDGAIPREALTSKPDAAGMFGDIAGGGAPAPAAAPPIPAAPAPLAPPVPAAPPAAPAAPQYVMTPAANGVTREAYHAAGWSDEQLIANGLLNPPAATPSFG